MNKAAQALGRRAAGVPKNYSAAEIERRKKRLAEASKLRWKGHVKKVKCSRCGSVLHGDMDCGISAFQKGKNVV